MQIEAVSLASLMLFEHADTYKRIWLLCEVFFVGDYQKLGAKLFFAQVRCDQANVCLIKESIYFIHDD